LISIKELSEDCCFRNNLSTLNGILAGILGCVMWLYYLTSGKNFTVLNFIVEEIVIVSLWMWCAWALVYVDTNAL
jgi:hypothetical protein